MHETLTAQTFESDFVNLTPQVHVNLGRLFLPQDLGELREAHLCGSLYGLKGNQRDKKPRKTYKGSNYHYASQVLVDLSRCFLDRSSKHTLLPLRRPSGPKFTNRETSQVITLEDVFSGECLKQGQNQSTHQGPINTPKHSRR